MRKPRLTDKVMDGLIAMCAVYEAAGPSEFFGFADVDESELAPDEKRQADQVEAASAWVSKMYQARKANKAAK